MAHVYRPGGLARDPLYCYHLCSRLGIILLSIQKNGCTAQKEWLLRAEGIPVVGETHRLAFERLSLLNRAAPVRDKALAELPIVCFLRDPLLRIASAFCDKLLSPLSFASATVIEGAAARRGVRIERDTTVPFPSMGPDALFAGCSRVDYERGLSFREYVEYLAGAPDLDLDPHFRPQAWFLPPVLARAASPNPPPTAFAPMDRLSEVLAELGRPLDLAPPPARRPGSDDPSPAEEDLSETPSGELRTRACKPRTSQLYTDELIDLALRRFAPDAELWRRLGQGAAAETLRSSAGTAAA